MRSIPPHSILFGIVLAAIVLAAPVSAVYDFEGIPLDVVAQGEVQGDVLTFGTYGLVAPPQELSFSLPSRPVWARVYTGVWGGTERYTGWEELTVNNGVPVRRNLFGIDDRHDETYVTGYGVYWIAHDCTTALHGGKNTISLATSRGQAESKIDGRVYGIFVVAVVEDKFGPVTKYWIAEGNENLHGEGWAGTNPTRHDSCEVSFDRADPAVLTGANLSILLLASTKGQPDYVVFNGQDLGVPPADMSNYPDGALDIGDERCGNAMGGAGTDTRYVDFETFPVGALLKENNTILFERGRDLDGDGVITTTGTKPEGEDYIHPSIAILTARVSGTQSGSDITVDTPRVKGAYAGEEATVLATVRNYGSKPAGKIPVTFSVDGKVVQTVAADPAASGVQEVRANMTLAEGRRTISVRAGESAEASVQVRVGTIPDLSVRIGAPVSAGAGTTGSQQSPLPLFAACAGLFIAAFLVRRPPGGKCAAVLIAGAVIVSSCPLIAPPAAAAGYADYTVPVTITNSGGSDAPSFDLTIYLDGARAAVKHIDDGVKAGETVTIDVPLYTTPGKHRLRIVADESGAVRDANPGNNAAEGDYVFP
ncbi:MAG: DUF3344 domain-containing protein [Methanofollis sp.]|uniref:DUF3344 domain-containing protein n=1 Tax=Methanofollis sp. TaxID=2052835 RepID=UPI00263A24CB|nr:DUF3344 domain-containing protein [Methanofollis sp.]MDD4254367.1 DUF3344 domain-containing protein [Methanofollis sp.]